VSISVVVIEDDADLRDTLADILERSAEASCIKLSSYEELVAAPDALRAQLAIIDINLGAERPSGIDASIWLREHGYTGKIVFLTGHASEHPLVEMAAAARDAMVLAKPVPLKQLLALVGDG
jgi:DNA-binding response OmpR family regulator